MVLIIEAIITNDTNNNKCKLPGVLKSVPYKMLINWESTIVTTTISKISTSACLLPLNALTIDSIISGHTLYTMNVAEDNFPNSCK